MPHKITYDPKKECIRVEVQGELNLQLLQSMASDVAEIVKERGYKYILNDLRKAKIVESAFNIYEMPKTAKKAGVTHICKRALIVGDRASEFHFLETVFLNQGHPVKMFVKTEDAEEWLFGEK